MQLSLNFRTFNIVLVFSFCNAAVIILAQLTVVKAALKIIIVSSLKVDSKELGGADTLLTKLSHGGHYCHSVHQCFYLCYCYSYYSTTTSILCPPRPM